MKTMRSIIPVMVLSVILLTWACEPAEKVSDIPQISFNSLEGPYLVQSGTVTTYGAILNFTFKDGNSDFGVDMTSKPRDTINLYMIPFQKIDGVYDSIDAELYGRKYTVKRDERMENGEGTVKGKISVLVQYVLKPPFDTIRYDFYIIDRAGNMSNVERTSDMAF